MQLRLRGVIALVACACKAACAAQTAQEAAADEHAGARQDARSGTDGGASSSGTVGPLAQLEVQPPLAQLGTTPSSLTLAILDERVTRLDVRRWISARGDVVSPCLVDSVEIADGSGVEIRLASDYGVELAPGVYVEVVDVDLHYDASGDPRAVDPSNDFIAHRYFEVSGRMLQPIDGTEYSTRVEVLNPDGTRRGGAVATGQPRPGPGCSR